MTGKEVYEKVGAYMESHFEMGQDNWEDTDQYIKMEWEYIATLCRDIIEPEEVM